MRDKIKASRGGVRGGAGRPLDPPRSEKEARERARARINALSEKAAETLEKGMDDNASPHAINAANSILDRAGIAKQTDVNITDPVSRLMLEFYDESREGE